MLIYNDLCVNKCPSDTYAEDEEIVNDVTGEKGIRTICKPCTKEKCHKSNVLSQFNFFLIRINYLKRFQFVRSTL